MNHQRGLDRNQTLMFPERLENYVDAFVASLDLHALGFARAQCAATGRPPYDAEQGQPDDHAGGERRVDGSDGVADESAAGEIQVAEDVGRTSVWDDQALVWVHALSAERFGEGADGVELDDAGVQPQTGAELGKLREIDVGGLPSEVLVRRTGRSKNPSKRLNWGGGALFSFAGSLILPDRRPHEPNLRKVKNRRPEPSDRRSNFSPPITLPAPEFSHSLAIG
jgi:hypothetical protein